MLNQLNIEWYKVNIDPFLTWCTKGNLKLIIALFVKSKTIKLQEEIIRDFCNLVACKVFLDRNKKHKPLDESVE